MAFEIFSRKIIRAGTPTLTVTKLGRLSLNKKATLTLEKNAVEHVLLLWDKEHRRIGVRPITKKDPRSYKVTYGVKGNGAGFSAKTFFDYINLDYSESRSMNATWTDDDTLLEVEVPKEFLLEEKQGKLVDMAEPRRTTKSA